MLTLSSPAKINLDLRIHHKRDDGFHQMSTIMAPLELHDTLHFEKADQWELVCDYPGVPLGEGNLVTKAVRELEHLTGREFLYKVTIEKVIPHGAGLAGGSSNAATALLAFNQLESLGLSLDKLAEIGAKFGSDVGFFVYQSICHCEGRGELVKPLDLKLTDYQVLLIKPSFGVSTPSAYQDWKSSREIQGVDYKEQRLPWGVVRNDLERPVFQKHRFLAELKIWLLDQHGVDVALMSGSGSTVFALCSQEIDSGYLIEQLLRQFDRKLWLIETRIAKL